MRPAGDEAAGLRAAFESQLPSAVIDDVLFSRAGPADGSVPPGVVAAAEADLRRLVRAGRWRDPCWCSALESPGATLHDDRGPAGG